MLTADLNMNKMTTRKEYVFKVINGIPIAADVYFRKTTTASKLPIGAQTTQSSSSLSKYLTR
jgi:hypothetical protein